METKPKKQAREYDSPLIRSLLAEIPPESYARTVCRMMMSARVEDGMIAKGMSKEEFAEKMKESTETIDIWFSGTHNFTLNTISDIQGVLGIKLLCLEEQ
jgi:ribosome-binding protein aMBF1 (putative translation factor)